MRERKYFLTCISTLYSGSNQGMFVCMLVLFLVCVAVVLTLVECILIGALGLVETFFV